MTKSGGKRYARNQRTLQDFNNIYGRNDTRLEKWQQLCRDVGVDEGNSINQCKRELKGNYLSINDFVSAIREGREPHVFRSYKALQSYLLNNDSVKFPKALAKESPILRWMLVEL